MKPRLGDIHREADTRDLWEVIALIDAPMMLVENHKTGQREYFVVDFPAFTERFSAPMREVEA